MKFGKSLLAHWPLLYYFSLYALFLYPVISLREGFIHGDYMLQVYPWMKVYAEALKGGQLLLWTPLIQSGFPLFAEGQTAMLYPLNLILFKFLPFVVAYNGVFLIHLLMGALFTFAFARKRGMTVEGATLTTLAFAFGSAFAGCFYGIFSLRPAAWFPLALYLVESSFGKRRLLPMAFLALVLGQCALSGNPQMMVYIFGFVGLYYLLRLWEERKNIPSKGGHILGFVASILVASLIGLPQIGPTFLLGLESTRSLHDPSFILWGSTAPWSLVTLLTYSWGHFLRSLLYIGIVPLLLVILTPGKRLDRICWILVAVSLLAALGRFNPLYGILTHIPGAALFRNPSKFLFFTAFFLSMIAGASLDRLTGKGDVPGEDTRTVLHRGKIFLRLMLVFIVSVGFIVHWAREPILKFGRWYVENFILNRSYHHHPPEHYFQAVHDGFESISISVSLLNPYLWLPWVFGILFMAAVSRWRRGRWRFRVFTTICLSLLVADLAVFTSSGFAVGFTGNLRPIPPEGQWQDYPRKGKWVDLVPGPDQLFPANRNMITGHAHAGAYSPLVDKRYYLLTSDLGVLDDGFGRREPEMKEFESRRPLINFLGIRYLVVRRAPSRGDYRRWEDGDGGRIFENPRAMGEFTYVTRTRSFPNEEKAIHYLKGSEFKPRQEAVIVEGGSVSPAGPASARIRILETDRERAVVEVNATGPGLLVRNQVFDPGWSVRVNGNLARITRANVAFQGVILPEGLSRVEFRYEPKFFWSYLGVSIGAMILITLVIFLNVLQNRLKLRLCSASGGPAAGGRPPQAAP